jgi:hypothetical protein
MSMAQSDDQASIARRNAIRWRRVIGALAVLLAIAMPAQGQDGGRDDWPDRLIIAAGPEGDAGFAYAEALATLLETTLDLPTRSLATGGAMQNLTLMQTGAQPLALAPLGPAAEAMTGDNPLAPGLRHDQVRALFAAYPVPLMLAVLAESAIGSLNELPDGAVVGIGPAGGLADRYAPVLFARADGTVETRNGNWDNLGQQLATGLIDALVVAAPPPLPTLQALESQTALAFLPLDSLLGDPPLDGAPVATMRVSADAYAGLEEDYDTVGMWTLALTHASVPDSLVTAVMNAVLGDPARLAAIQPDLPAPRIEAWHFNPIVPFHPAAIDWYQDQGIAIPAELHP